MSSIEAIDTTVHTTETWLKAVMDEMGWGDRRQAYRALRAALHTLRDRLTVEEAAHLGAQLPMLIRGLYYEGWAPARTPIKHDREGFLAAVRAGLEGSPDVDPLAATRAVFRVLETFVTPGEIADVKGQLPRELQSLWDTRPEV
jgi:uncharacterized protein (DUF2267 family)